MPLVNTYGAKLVLAFQDLWISVIGFVPQLLSALIVFIAGWLIAIALGKVVAQIVHAAKVDKALQGLGVEEPLERAGMKLDVGAFLGGVVKWFFIVVFLMVTLEVLKLDRVSEFLGNVVVTYIPQVFVATLILVAAALLADTVSKIVAGSAKAASLPSAGFLGGVAKWSIWIFGIMMAMSQLGIAGDIVKTLLTGLVGALALATGLAFGLGGKDVAAKYLERLRQDISNR